MERMDKLMNNLVDMRSTLGETLESYSRLTYKVETAIAEFVDNSTQNYFSFKNELEKSSPNFILRIYIDYDFVRKTLTIIDNAMGMKFNEFYSALIISRKTENTKGRSEFGMGLKTAASWFSKIWEVETKHMNEDKVYYVKVDIPEIKNKKINQIKIFDKTELSKQHYTKITLKELNKPITELKLSKLRSELASIYRRDIQNEKIKIYINREELTFEYPQFLREERDGKMVTYRKEFKESLIFEGLKYDLSGFVGLRFEGSYEETGFTLIRRGRVITGGFKNGFKPPEIFKKPNSFISLRLFGEVELDNWPVTQAKDEFDWDGSGLKEIFIDKLKEVSLEYARKAESYRVNADKHDSKVSEKDAQSFAQSTVDDLSKVKQIQIDQKSPIKIETNNENASYSLNIKLASKIYNIKVSFTNQFDSDLFEVEFTDKYIDVKINSNYPFFDEYIGDKKLMNILQRLIVIIVLSEERAKLMSDSKGKINPQEIREYINQILKEIVLERTAFNEG
jgi:hypothetical protein